MPPRNSIILILATSFTSKMHGQNFDHLTAQIFFNVDIKRCDTTIIAEFKAKPEFILEENRGWTSYPPNVDIGNILPFQTFTFSQHPYFLSELTHGQLTIFTSRERNKVMGMSISLSFESFEACEAAYKNIKKLYGKYSSRTIKRPNIAPPCEITKYLSKDGKDYIIVSKGKSHNKPYLDIAYNHQGYDW